VVSAAISAVAVLGVAVIGVVGTRQHKATRSQLRDNTTTTRAVLHQVKNDHGTNLRDDLDEVMQKVSAHSTDLARVGSMLGKVRKVATEVQEAQKAHDAASLVIVEQLHRADRELARELRAHHPRVMGN
jgi:hypothetical protein